MLYIYPRLPNHQAYRLNRNIIYFFSKLRSVNEHSVFNTEDYFSTDFANFLRSQKQNTLNLLINSFFESFKILPYQQKTEIILHFRSLQKINLILTDDQIACNQYFLNNLPQQTRRPSKLLFEYLFANTLKSYGKLKDHYALFFSLLESNICPFCGIELLNKPSIVRQDYDHILMQSKYVFASVNMENLVPTGTECNRINKHSIDAVHFHNVRAVFNSPYYGYYAIKVSLTGSTPPATIDGNGNWIIGISPDNNYTRQWAYVYNIRQRYSDNILNKSYKGWLKELRAYLINKNLIPITRASLHDELNAQAATLTDNPVTSLGNIVKGAFYEFVSNYPDHAYHNYILNYINN